MTEPAIISRPRISSLCFQVSSCAQPAQPPSPVSSHLCTSQVAAASWQESQEKAGEVSEAERQFAEARIAELEAQIASLQTELLAADEAVKGLESKARSGPTCVFEPSSPSPPASQWNSAQQRTAGALPHQARSSQQGRHSPRCPSGLLGLILLSPLTPRHK